MLKARSTILGILGTLGILGILKPNVPTVVDIMIFIAYFRRIGLKDL